MSELRYPNESREYRDARDLLLKDERELVDKVKSVAAKRRTLPLGGQLKEDYVFQWANDGKVGKRVKFSELFGDKRQRLTAADNLRDSLYDIAIMWGFATGNSHRKTIKSA